MPSADADSAELFITPAAGRTLHVDMVSLFPHATFKGRENGLRADLAEILAGLKPKFVRFPGGCVAHGNGVDNIYDWKGSIGELYERKPLSNLWGYHQTRALAIMNISCSARTWVQSRCRCLLPVCRARTPACLPHIRITLLLLTGNSAEFQWNRCLNTYRMCSI